MKETSIYSYYVFGYNYRVLQETLEEKTNATNAEAIKDIEKYLEKVTTLELQVTSQVLGPLRKQLETLKKLKADEKMTAAAAAQVLEIIEAADHTLDAELQLKKVLSVTPKRFDLNMLLRSPSGLLSAGCWDKMTETGTKDFFAATRCIAMNLPTAAAFHLMRCVEDCVKLLYFKYVKHGRMDKPMWGPMVDKLRSKNKPRPPKELLDHLDIVRANFRNPTQHPEKFYTSDEAQDLLNATIVAIGYICREL